MIVLGVETATIEVGAGLSRDGSPLGSLVARPGLRHVETLHPAIAALCEAAGITLCDIDAVAVDIGPGLFTGLRVGIAAAKTLAFGLRVPTIGVTSTEILIRQSALSGVPVVPVIDMRRGEIAWSLPKSATLSNDQERAIELGSPETLAEQFSELNGNFLLVGDGARRYSDRIIGDGGALLRLASHDFDAPSVATLVAIASERFEKGATTDAFALTPLYLRDADAKVNFDVRAGAAKSAVS